MKVTDILENKRIAQLPEGTPREKIDWILDRPDAEAFIKAVDPPVLFQLVKDAGWEEAENLIPYATPRQLQVCYDLDCWSRDRFRSQKLAPWLAAVLSETDDQTFRRDLREMDPEVIALFFKENLEVGLLDEHGDIPIEFEDKPVSLSPDNIYAIVYPYDENMQALMRGLLDRLYDVDRVLAWTLLEAVRWELQSNMEEEAYRWRNSRLEEYGFVERDEALAVYSYLSPTKFRDKVEGDSLEEKMLPEVQPSNLPALPSIEGEQRFYFYRVLGAVRDSETLERLAAEFVGVQNRTLIADGAEPGSLDEARGTIERTAGYTSLGLEYLSRRDDERAIEILETVAIRDIFRTGFSMTWKLRGNASKLRYRPSLTLVEGQPFSLLSDDDAALMEGLLETRPVFAERANELEIFYTQDQVDQAAIRIGMIAFKQLWCFGVMKMAPADLATLVYETDLLNEPPAVSFDAVFATVLARTLLNRAGEVEADVRGVLPLSTDELAALPEIVDAHPWGDDPIDYFKDVVGDILEALPGGSARLATRWLEATLERLVDEFAGVSDVEPAEMFQHVLLIRE